MAQKEAEKVGITFNFNKVQQNLKNQFDDEFVDQVESLANKAEQAANSQAAAVQQNPNVKKAQQFANRATFNGVVNNIQRELKAQLRQIPNAPAKKNLISLLDQGAAEAKNRLNAEGLGNKNIKKTAQQEYNKRLPQAQAEQAKLKQKLNQAIRNL